MIFSYFEDFVMSLFRYLFYSVGEVSGCSWDKGGMNVTGEIHVIGVESISIQRGFPKIMDYNESQTNFTVGFVLVTLDKSTVTQDSKDKVNRLRKMLEEQRFEATPGLATMRTELV